MTPTKVRRYWDAVQTSYWFVPAIMSACAIVLGLLMVEVDHAVAWEGFGLMARTGTEGTRAVLATIAGSMITVAATVFSITIVALSLASQQYGPRLLRNFMRDRSNQVVLGTFTSTFLYCLMVLRTVSGVDDERFVPHLSVGVGVLLAVLSLGVLIFFIHHVAVSIQVEHVTEAVARELDEQIETLFPEDLGEPPPRDDQESAQMLPPRFELESKTVCFEASGYLQTIDEAVLMRVATERDLVVRLDCRPGAFSFCGDRCAAVWPGDRVDRATADKIRESFQVGPNRTPIQDAEFAINQLVEVALRAMSPSLNDPFTAQTCIDRLGAGLAKLAERPRPSPYRVDEGGSLRIVVAPFEFSRLVSAAFDPLRQFDTDHQMVAAHLVHTIERVAQRVSREADREYLARLASQVRTQHEEYLRRSATLPRAPQPSE